MTHTWDFSRLPWKSTELCGCHTYPLSAAAKGAAPKEAGEMAKGNHGNRVVIPRQVTSQETLVIRQQSFYIN